MSDCSGPHPSARRPGQVTLAEDRTILAAERTFASWLRTGLAFLSVGLGLQRFLRDQFPSWELRLIGAVLVLCAAASFAAAAWRDRRTRLRLPEPEIHLLPGSLSLGVASVLVAVSLLAEVAIWVG